MLSQWSAIAVQHMCTVVAGKHLSLLQQEADQAVAGLSCCQRHHQVRILQVRRRNLRSRRVSCQPCELVVRRGKQAKRRKAA